MKETSTRPSSAERPPADDPPAPPVSVSESLHTTNVLLGVLASVVVAASLKVAAPVLVPLVLAIFLAYLLTPVMNLLARARVPEILALPVLLGLVVALVAALEVLVAETVDEIQQRAPFYARRFEELAEQALSVLGGNGRALRRVDWIGQLTGAAADQAGSFFGRVLDFVANLVLVATYTVFLLIGRKHFEANLARAYEEQRATEIRSVFAQINGQIQQYIGTKVVLSLVTGGLMYLALLFFGVDFALFFGLLGFLLSFIPTVGSAIAALLPILLSLVQFPSPLTSLYVAIALISIQQIIGNGVEPKLLGRRLNLSPIVVLFALVFFGWLWGFWGMIVSVPLMAALKIVMVHTRSLKSLAVLLEN